MIGILGAMEIEIRSLRESMVSARERVLDGISYFEGELGGVDVVVARCGVGKVNAALCAQRMILEFRPELVINLGVAGAIADGLRVGDIVVGEDAVQHDVDTTCLGDPKGMVSTICLTYFPLDCRAREAFLAAGARAGLRCLPGRIATGDQFIASEARKREIAEDFGATVCDMEGCAIAQACYIANVPCALIRSISDGADGGAKMSFATFLEAAANNSSELLKAFLSAR